MLPSVVPVIAAATLTQLYWVTHNLSESMDGGCLSDSIYCSYYISIIIDTLVVLLLYASVSAIPLLKRCPHIRFAVGGLWLAGLWFCADMEIWNAYEGSWSTYSFTETLHSVWLLAATPIAITIVPTLLLLYRLQFRAA